MEENEQAILDWVNTFEIENKCSKLSELNDGTVLSEILYEIAPSYFEKDSLNKDASGNWALAAGNLRKLIRMLDGYYKTVLHKEIDMTNVDVNHIAKSSDPDDILHLLELVVGVAVMCEDKAVFIRNIFQLNELSQAVLKGLVESVLSRAEDTGGGDDDAAAAGDDDFAAEEEGGGDGFEEEQWGDADEAKYRTDSFKDKPLKSSTGEGDADQMRLHEMLQHLQFERQRLLGEVSTLESNNDTLKSELAKVAETSQLREQERVAVEGSDRSRLHTLEHQNSQLLSDLDDLKREHDLKIVETETLRHDMKAQQQKLDAAKELQAKLEMENHQQADELDIARDKVAKLARAEATVEKYHKRLEEMVDLKKQNKELSDQMDEYLDKIHDLESANKGLGAMNKMVEQYKNRAVDLETEKFEAQSAAEMREEQVRVLTADLEKARLARRQAQDEAASLRIQLEQYEEDGGQRGRGGLGSASGLDLDDSYQVETVPLLKERVKKLERDLRLAVANSGGPGVDGGDTKLAAALQEVCTLQQELEDVRTQKKSREEALLATKKQVQELQHELSQTQESNAEMSRTADSGVLKELQQKLAETANTVRLLQDKLKEKESAINKVEQEKSKLENYTKRSLGTFKDKYMAVLQTLKDEKEDLQQKIRAQVEKSERNQETWHREERLISSAMYELGVRIMDQKIQSQMLESASSSTPKGQAGSGSTFMSAQKDSLLARSASSMGMSTPKANA